MSSNTTENHRRGFRALTGREAGSFCLLARCVDLDRCIGHTLSPPCVPLPRLTGVPPDSTAGAGLCAPSDPHPS